MNVNESLLRTHVIEINGFPRPGVSFRDITPILRNPIAMRHAVRAMSALSCIGNVTIVGVESRGFILGAALAHERRESFVPIRKDGKLPRPVWSEVCNLEYGREILNIHKDALGAWSRVVVVDDVLATGGTLEAAVRLVRKAGAEVIAAVTLIEIEALAGRKKIEEMGVRVESVLKF